MGDQHQQQWGRVQVSTVIQQLQAFSHHHSAVLSIREYAIIICMMTAT